MITVNTDREKKLVDLQITGFVKPDDVMRAANEIKATMKWFGPSEAFLLIDLTGFTPMTNDVFPMLRGLGRDVISFYQKAALVQEFNLSFQGGRKAIEPPPGYPLPSFATREKALAYLQEDTN